MTNEGLTNQVQQLDAAPNQNETTSVPQGKMLSQDEVNYLASKIKREAYEKGRQEALSERQINNQEAPQMSMTSLSEQQIIDLIEKKADEKARNVVQQVQQEQMNNYMARQIVGELETKLERGRKEHEDFDKIAGRFDLSKAPQMVRLLNSVPNSEDVIYELGKKPGKFGNIQILLATGQEEAAKHALKDLSDSISANKDAAKESKKTRAPEPLTQLKPSTASVDSGQPSVKDLKKLLKR